LKRRKKRTNIVLTNIWSYYNKGDAAIVVGMMNNLNKAYPNADFSLLAFDPESFELSKYNGEISQKVHILPEISCTKTMKRLLSIDRGGIVTLFLLLLLPIIVSVFQIFDSNLKKSIHTLKKADIVISCGGNQLHSNLGFSFLRNLFPLIWGKLVCKKPVMIFSQSIGPINGFLNRQILKFVLERVDYITLRENYSDKYLHDVLGIQNQNIIVTADATFMLDSNPQNLQLEHSQKIGITVRQWFFFQSNFYNHYIKVVANFIDYLNEVHDIDVILFSFSSVSGLEDDLIACKNVYSLVQDKRRLKVIQLGNLSLKESMRELLKTNLFFGTRMHSVIFASILGIHSVAISYHQHKSKGISEMLGLIKPLDINNLTLDQMKDSYEKLQHSSKTELLAHIQDLRSRLKINMSIINRLIEKKKETS
jgi:colanic acid/amylovoran biosynthesis protein